jgi:glutamate carboxypeptidase
MTASSAPALLAYLRGRLGAMTGLLERLARAESPSQDPASQAGPQELLRAALEERGFRVRHLRGRSSGGCLLAKPASRWRQRPIQMLLGHCDTVWPIGTLQNMPVHLRNGRLHGPGVFDMKAGLVQGLFDLEAVQRLEPSLQVEPLMLVNSDEEIGSGESTPHIRRLARRCDRVFVLEPSLGQGGRLKTTRKGVGRFEVHVEGRAAHAGLDPEKGVSAILELSHVVQQLFALNDPERGITVNVGTIEGGLQPNVIAPHSRAMVDVRMIRREDAQRIEQAIGSLRPSTPGTRIRVEGRIRRQPLESTPGNRRLWERARAAATELGIQIEQASAGGGSDGNTTSLYAPTLDGLGAVGDGAHAAHEHVVLEAMAERAALLACLLLDGPMLNRDRTLRE